MSDEKPLPSSAPINSATTSSVLDSKGDEFVWPTLQESANQSLVKRTRVDPVVELYVEPSESSIRYIIEMGFPRSRAIYTLKEHSNNMSMAIEALLNGFGSQSDSMEVLQSTPKDEGDEELQAALALSRQTMQIQEPSVDDNELAAALALSLANGPEEPKSLTAAEQAQWQQHESEQLSKAVELSLIKESSNTTNKDEEMLPPTRVASPHQRSPGAPIGLKNTGNVCYASAMFQVYYSLPFWRSSLFALKANAEEKQERLVHFIQSLQWLMAQMQLSKRMEIDPSSALNATLAASRSTALKLGEQEDIDEFNNLFMSRLEDAYKALGGDVAELREIFIGTQCIETNRKQDRKSDPFLQLILDISNANDLYEALDHYTAPRMIENQDNFSQTTWIEKLPRVLCLQLERVRYNASLQRPEKQTKSIHFPVELYLDRYLLERSSQVETIRERLTLIQKQQNALEQQLREWRRFGQVKPSMDAEHRDENGTYISLSQVLSLSQAFLVSNQDIIQSDEKQVANQALEFMKSCEERLEKKKTEVMQQWDELGKEAELCFNQDEWQTVIYHLHAVVVHQGEAGAGHYFAFIRHDQQWFKCNDSFVRAVSLDELMQDALQGAYYLVYSKEKDPVPLEMSPEWIQAVSLADQQTENPGNELPFPNLESFSIAWNKWKESESQMFGELDHFIPFLMKLNQYPVIHALLQKRCFFEPLPFQVEAPLQSHEYMHWQRQFDDICLLGFFLRRSLAFALSNNDECAFISLGQALDHLTKLGDCHFLLKEKYFLFCHQIGVRLIERLTVQITDLSRLLFFIRLVRQMTLADPDRWQLFYTDFCAYWQKLLDPKVNESVLQELESREQTSLERVLLELIRLRGALPSLTLDESRQPSKSLENAFDQFISLQQ